MPAVAGYAHAAWRSPHHAWFALAALVVGVSGVASLRALRRTPEVIEWRPPR